MASEAKQVEQDFGEVGTGDGRGGHFLAEVKMKVKRRIFGLGYKAKSGKDTLAVHLAQELGFEHEAFGNALKNAVKAVFHLTDEQLWGDQKEVVDPFWGKTPREIMQTMGDALRTHFGKEVYVRSLERKISLKPDANWVISDVRYPDTEAAFLKRIGGKLIRMDRPGSGASGGLTNHSSENAMDSYDDWDTHIKNDTQNKVDLYERGLEALNLKRPWLPVRLWYRFCYWLKNR